MDICEKPSIWMLALCWEHAIRDNWLQTKKTLVLLYSGVGSGGQNLILTFRGKGTSAKPPPCVNHPFASLQSLLIVIQKNSRRLWRSQRRKSRSVVPEGGADFPAAILLAGKCPNHGRDSISWCPKIGEEFASSIESCRNTLPARNFGQPQPSRLF